MKTLQEVREHTAYWFSKLGVDVYRKDIIDLHDAGMWDEIFDDASQWEDDELSILVSKYLDFNFSNISDDEVFDLIFIINCANEIMIPRL